MIKSHAMSSLDQYRVLFEEVDDILLIVDQKGKIAYVNRALRKRLGYKSKQFTGRSLAESCLFDKKMTRKEMVELVFSHRDFFTQVQQSKEVVFQYAWKTKVFVHHGKKKAVAVVRDVTSQLELQRKVQDYTKNLEDMVFQRTRQLEVEKQKAIELNQAKVAFLSKMSHELRTPLTAIRGYAELLQESTDLNVSEKKKYVSVIEKNARHLLDMITETLQIIQMEHNKYKVREKTFFLKPFLEDLIETYTVLASQKGLLLECQISEGIPDKLYSDPNAIRQILTNLIGNAIKFTEQGKVVLSIKERSLPHKLSKKLYFSIEDTGLGIPKHEHQRIFKSYEQYLEHQSTQSRGTGLGLPISRQLAKLLGGEVKLVSSEPYKGSVFVFSLKVRQAPKSS
jgi:PAS domain S-box-containing protein